MDKSAVFHRIGMEHAKNPEHFMNQDHVNNVARWAENRGVSADEARGYIDGLNGLQQSGTQVDISTGLAANQVGFGQNNGQGQGLV